MIDIDWNFDPWPPEGGDARKLVTLEQDGMTWVGIRAWSGVKWLNNGAVEKAKVLAWAPLPQPAVADGLMQPMAGPTLPEGPL